MEEFSIKSLIREGEHISQDFKHEINSFSKIAKTISAFANTHGGRILVGVKDNGAIKGINPEEETHMLEGAATQFCKPSVHLLFDIQEDEGKKVLIGTVPKNEKELVYAKDDTNQWWAYFRNADETLLASGVIYKVMKQRLNKVGVKIQYKEEEQKILKLLSEKGFLTFSDLKMHTNIANGKKLSNILVNLICTHIISCTLTNSKEYFSIKR